MLFRSGAFSPLAVPVLYSRYLDLEYRGAWNLAHSHLGLKGTVIVYGPIQ